MSYARYEKSKSRMSDRELQEYFQNKYHNKKPNMNLNEEKNRCVPTAKVVINGEQTYRIGFDDNHIVVSSGSEKHDKQVWLSKELIRWLADNFEVVSRQPPMDLEITIAKTEE